MTKRAQDIRPITVVNTGQAEVVRVVNALLEAVQVLEREHGIYHGVPADGKPRQEEDWKQIAHELYVALLGHRSDMHGASVRPCRTCNQSAVAIRAYDEAIDRDVRRDMVVIG